MQSINDKWKNQPLAVLFGTLTIFSTFVSHKLHKSNNLAKMIIKTEQKLDTRVTREINMLSNHILQSEQRLDTRITKEITILNTHILKLDDKIDKLETKIDDKINKLETKIDNKINKLDTKMDQILTFMNENNKTNEIIQTENKFIYRELNKQHRNNYQTKYKSNLSFDTID